MQDTVGRKRKGRERKKRKKYAYISESSRRKTKWF